MATTPKKVVPRVQDVRPLLGSDPEFFFRNDKGEVIGAEKVIPEKGWKVGHNMKANIIIDGVQAEINPSPYTCREGVWSELSLCFRNLTEELAKAGMKVVPDFSRTVEISKENLMELSEKSRMFGCAPSESIYDNNVDIASVDPMEYRIRAAGGHIHIGMPDGYTGNSQTDLKVALKDDYIRTIHMLDVICGNTCVLVDRDPANIERRKVYGRAGEFRRPKHGLEYRTLSNFWLSAPPLVSLAFGMARLAVQLIADGRRDTYYKAIMKVVDMKKVQTAINTNDYDLAMENFMAIVPIILDAVITEAVEKNPEYGNSAYPIDHKNLKDFLWFSKMVNEKGLTYFFNADPMYYLSGANTYNIRQGFNDFLKVNVQPMRLKWEAEEAERVKKEEALKIKKPVAKKLGIEVIYAKTEATITKRRGRAKKVA